MTTCRGCGALVQPEWDRCKICGWDGSEIEEAPTTGRAARRARKTAKAGKSAPAAAPGGITMVAPPPAPSRAPAPARATRAPRPPKAARKTEAPVWLLALALIAVIVGCLVIIFKDPDDSSNVSSDIPAAESDLDAGAPEWESLGEWDLFVGGGGLKVQMPGLPLQEADRMSVPNVGFMEVNKATVVGSGVTVTAGWAIIPEGLRARPDLMLEGLAQAEAEALEGEIAAQKDVTVDGMPAMRVRVSSTIGEVRLAVIAGPTYVYLLQADAGDQGTLYLQRLIDTFDS